MSKKLAEYLASQGLLTTEQMRSKPPETVLTSLINGGQLDEKKLADHLSRIFSLPFVELTSIDPRALSAISFENMKALHCVPFQLKENGVRVAVADPTKIVEMKPHFKMPVFPEITTFTNLAGAIAAIEQAHGVPAPAQESAQALPPTQTPEQAPSAPPQTKSQVHTFNAKDPVIGILNKILDDAITKDASDIHIEAEPKRIRIRFRMEGLLIDAFIVPVELRDQLISRVKIIAGLDISERKVPQDGRAKMQIENKDYTFRINTMPAINGETIAIRIMKPENVNLSLLS